MRRKSPTTTKKQQSITPGEVARAAAFWKGAADEIAATVRAADDYLPDYDEALDADAKTEVYNALVQARVAADTALGAYTRVAEAMRVQGQQQAAQYHGQPAPAAQQMHPQQYGYVGHR